MASASKLSRPPPAIAAIRASVPAPMGQELDEKSRKTDILLSSHGTLLSQLEDSFAFVPMTRCIAIFEEAAKMLPERTLGAQMGISFKPADTGPIGNLFSTSSTVRTAFKRLSKHITALQGATSLALISEDDRVLWTYKIEDPRLWPRYQDAVYTLTALCQLGRSCCSSNWRPLEIHLEHGAPSDLASLNRIFRVPIRFSQSGNRIVMERSDVDRACYPRQARHHLARFTSRLSHAPLIIRCACMALKSWAARTVADWRVGAVQELVGKAER
jgi:hypothetical protein